MSDTHITDPYSTRAPLKPFEELLTSGLKLLFSSIDNARAFTQLAYDTLPRMQGMRYRSPSCCEIPEQDCPPRCFCSVVWEAIPGETLALTIRVRNTSSRGQRYAAFPSPFSGPGAPATFINVNPRFFALAPGQTGIVDATYTVPAGTPQGRFQAEVLLRIPGPGGTYYERAACITLKVGCERTCGDPCGTCCVDLGDVPQRIRAHQWYHHFQCTSHCDLQQGRYDEIAGAQQGAPGQNVPAAGAPGPNDPGPGAPSPSTSAPGAEAQTTPASSTPGAPPSAA